MDIKQLKREKDKLEALAIKMRHKYGMALDSAWLEKQLSENEKKQRIIEKEIERLQNGH